MQGYDRRNYNLSIYKKKTSEDGNELTLTDSYSEVEFDVNWNTIYTFFSWFVWFFNCLAYWVVVSWTKGVADGINAVDIEMSRLSQDQTLIKFFNNRSSVNSFPSSDVLFL